MTRIATLLATLLVSIGALAQFGQVTQGAVPTISPSQPALAYDSTNALLYGCFGGCQLPPDGVVLLNAASTGTTANTLSKLTGAGTAVIAGTGDNKNGVVIGIAVAGAGTSGSVTLQAGGIAPCVFDNATTQDDFVTVSTGTAGNCHDAGSTQPIDGSQIIGRVLSTNGGAGTYKVLLNQLAAPAGSGVGNGAPKEVYNTAQTAGNTSISATTIYTPAAAGNYRISYYLTQTVLGTSCAANPTVQVAVKYQDPNAAAGQVVNLGLHTITTNGTLGVVPWTSGPTTWTFQSSANVIQIQTTYTNGTSCSPNPIVQLIPVLEAY